MTGGAGVWELTVKGAEHRKFEDMERLAVEVSLRKLCVAGKQSNLEDDEIVTRRSLITTDDAIRGTRQARVCCPRPVVTMGSFRKLHNTSSPIGQANRLEKGQNSVFDCFDWVPTLFLLPLHVA